ncbi:6-phosphogluconolactonase [Marinobacter orientalis]|uniref:6-phosphogluconolactonase n=2 Tax=Marinobacter orientalis TaxID=1928859 RepID=A0A7Y0WT86_9GAMM|nr:6-phosphogluconolactonase [Marinobacter orientalis]TGX48399.1 6-phosphogluconolactonase [Marinobacter orientalis]
MHDLNLPDGVDAHFFDTPDDAAVALADAVANHLAERLLIAPRASLVVSGGSTPRPFFGALRQKPLDWARIDVLLADERWVPEDDESSNTRLVKENLLQGPAAEANYLSLKQPGDTPADGLAAVEAALADLHLPLDVLILGMGNDGHTASLFPDAPELDEALDTDSAAIVAPVTPPSRPEKRITLTLGALSRAGFTALHLKGDDKLETLKAACSDIRQVKEMPVRAFLRPGLQIFWSA